MIDFAGLLDGPLYRQLGVDGVVTLPGSGASHVLRLLDCTAGVEIQQGGFELPSLKPAVQLRRADLVPLGLAPQDLVQGVVAVAGDTWRIESWKARPSPASPASGDFYLILTRES